jgi:ATP-dependent Lhr-like helicase
LQPCESKSYRLLDERIQRWIFQQGWETLRSSQEEAIPAILGGDQDVIISAPTSAGKTEAAFLPILTSVLNQSRGSVQVLYVGPLKSLINDQFARLDLLCDHLDIAVHRWHGDVTHAEKKRLVGSPNGVLLITPESLEALMMRQGTHVSRIFSNLSFVVVDEIHSFIGNERGAQLQSLLHRIEFTLNRRVPRIGLSATLAEPEVAVRFLRPNGSYPSLVIVDSVSGELKAQLAAFYRSEQRDGQADENQEKSAETRVVEFLMKTMGGHHNLVFCNKKSDVETYADALSETCRKRFLTDEYCAHHGNLSKELREDVEDRLKSKERPVTCVCTSTLEMGIDIGAMRSIGQIGPPPSVASLRQRVGRSGRRGEASVLRLIAVEEQPSAKSSLDDRLHLKFIRAAACIELMSEGWCESPRDKALHLSTLIQQIMSVVIERGGATIPFLYKMLVREGTFAQISQDQFADLLRSMGGKDLIVQSVDGTILLGGKGEQMAEHFSFYSAFSTPDEYQLIGEGKSIGSMPITLPLKVDDPLLFGGKRWRVVQVDDSRKVIGLVRSEGKRPPAFLGDGARVDGEIRKRMFELLVRDDVPIFMNPMASAVLSSSRSVFAERKLSVHRVIEFGNETLIFPWSGDLETSTLRLLLASQGMTVEPSTDVLVVHGRKTATLNAMASVCSAGSLNEASLAATVGNKLCEKHDWVLSETLLVDEYSAKNIDLPGAISLAKQILASCGE